MTDLTRNLAGKLIDDFHQLSIRVYYEDTDFSGIVYHANYLKYLERGRSDYLRLKNVHHNELGNGKHGQPMAFAVRHMDIDFLSSARIDDVVTVQTETRLVKGARLILLQSICHKKIILVRAKVTIAMISRDGKPLRIPGVIRSALAKPE